MIDFQTENIIPICEAPKFVPGRPHLATVIRWFGRGIRGVRLETALCGGRRFTSLEAIHRFFAATTAAGDGQPVQARTPHRRLADHTAADAELRAAGW